MAFGDDEIGMPCSNPRLLHTGQPLEPTHFVLVRPDDQMFSRGRAPGMDPSLLDPVMDLLGDGIQLTRQVGNPPLGVLEQVVAKLLADQAQFPHQRADP